MVRVLKFYAENSVANLNKPKWITAVTFTHYCFPLALPRAKRRGRRKFCSTCLFFFLVFLCYFWIFFLYFLILLFIIRPALMQRVHYTKMNKWMCISLLRFFICLFILLVLPNEKKNLYVGNSNLRYWLFRMEILKTGCYAQCSVTCRVYIKAFDVLVCRNEHKLHRRFLSSNFGKWRPISRESLGRWEMESFGSRFSKALSTCKRNEGKDTRSLFIL